jgi:hypothetical protein
MSGRVGNNFHHFERMKARLLRIYCINNSKKRFCKRSKQGYWKLTKKKTKKRKRKNKFKNLPHNFFIIYELEGKRNQGWRVDFKLRINADPLQYPEPTQVGLVICLAGSLALHFPVSQ